LATDVGIACAQEGSLLNGTYTIKVYQADCDGSSSCATANPASSVLGGSLLATLTYTGAINFTDGGVNEILHFLQSGGGSISGDTSGLTGKILSSGGFGTTTFLDITFITGSIQGGNIEHDDGVSLYVGDSLLTPAEAAAPTTAVGASFVGSGGTYRLIYSSALGLPEVLILSGTQQPDFVDFGCQIDLAQTGVAPAFKTVLSAVGSEKFCPATNGGVLKLGCSGTIPNYTGDPVVSTTGVVCRISGSQCGLPGEFVATVKSISVATGGFTELSCEAILPPPG